MQEKKLHEKVRVEGEASSAVCRWKRRIFMVETISGNKVIQCETDYLILGKTSVKVGKRTEDVPRKRTRYVANFL